MFSLRSSSESESGPQLHSYGTVPAGNPSPVGTLCPNFPADADAVLQLTKGQIANLSIFFNDDFGIQADDAELKWQCMVLSRPVRKSQSWYRSTYLSAHAYAHSNVSKDVSSYLPCPTGSGPLN